MANDSNTHIYTNSKEMNPKTKQRELISFILNKWSFMLDAKI